MEEVPPRTSLAPLASPCFVLCLIGVETEGLLHYGGKGGNHFHCTVEPSPGHTSKSETWVPKRGGLKPAGKRHFPATQRFRCCSAVFRLLQRSFWYNDVRIAEKRMLQCSFCSAAFRKLHCNFCFRLYHVAGVGFRGVGFRTS